MAYSNRLKLRPVEKIVKLINFTEAGSMRLSDQLVEKLGTSRRSEIKGVITDSGEPYEKIMTDYLLGL